MIAQVPARYRRFAEQEARGRSPLYEALALGVADDPDTLDFLLTLPVARQQPNLLFAAVRHLFGIQPGWPGFRRALLANRDAVRAVMLARATQTNEPARCATLLPVLAQVPQPLALIEVGASAGLCLLPDYYGYDYGGVRLGGTAPVFACSVNAATPVPDRLPDVVWRAGLDLNPLDPADPDQAAWLQTLVWPEQTERAGALQSALAIAASVRPRIVQGSLLDGTLEALCAEAPRDATLVIFHTAVLAYVEARSDRDAFARRAMALCPYWIANEAGSVFGHTGGPAGRFALAVNGSPVAWSDPHGAALDWIG